MKIALVHDYIKEYGGAERVLEALHELYPDAPVYTSVYLPKFLGPHKERFKNWDIHTSFFQQIPYKEKLISVLRLFAPLAFARFDLSEYDVVIVSATGAYISNSIVCHPELDSGSTKGDSDLRQNDKGPVHICYCHTPPRYLYGFATARDWKKNPIVRVLAELANHVLRMLDWRASQNVDFFIANSKNTAGRIEKFYRKNSTVIYPPVDTAFSLEASSVQLEKKLNPQKLNAKRYFVAGGRLARPKHIDLIVRACREQDLPLKVFGRGFAGYEEELKVQSSKLKVGEPGSNIEFLGEVSDEEKLELMKNAKAFIFAAEDEDFGITPVEAMSVGTPVVAYRSGGVVESVVENKTGVFFDELTVESLARAIKSFDKLRINAGDCIDRAEKFSKERFKKEIQTFVNAKA